MSTLTSPSLKKNALLSDIRLALSFLLPLVTFPYVSRILGTDGVGKVEFANSFAQYFVLFTALGIPTYGIREVSRVRDDSFLLSKTVAELSLILVFTVFAGYVVYFACIFFIPFFNSEPRLFLIVAPTIILSDFSFEWFYQGIENQRYITVRYIFIKLAQLVLIFAFIKQTADYLKYALILVGLNAVSSVFNIAHLRKYVHFVPYKCLELKKHLRPILVIFASVVAVSIYTQLDTVMIGFFRGNGEVGVYTAANRVVRIVIALVTSLSSVIIPKLVSALKNNHLDEYKNLLDKSLSFVLLLALPCIFGILVCADDIILLFAGSDFESAIFSIRLLCPIILIVGLASFVGLQVLYANKKEKYYTVAVSVAATVNFVSNFIMIPKIGQVGAVFGTLIAETVGLCIMSFLGRVFLMEAELKVHVWKYFLGAGVMGIAVFLLKRFFVSLEFPMAARLSMCVLCGAVLYALVMILLKENLCINLLRQVRNKLRRGK
mgnify:FL=1